MLIMKKLFYILFAFVSFNLNAQNSTQDLLLTEYMVTKDTCTCLGLVYTLPDTVYNSGNCISYMIKYYKVNTWKKSRTFLWNKETDKKFVSSELLTLGWEPLFKRLSSGSEIFVLGCYNNDK